MSQGLPVAEIAAPHRSTPSPLAGPAIALRRMTPADAFRWSAEWYERKRLLEEACAGMRGWCAHCRLLSVLQSTGKCEHCGGGIDRRHEYVEAGY